MQEKLRLEELEFKERAAIRQYDLELLRISNTVEINSNDSTQSSLSDGGRRKIKLRDLVPMFDPKKLDISLFFTLFERQAKKEG